jgi:hypothetical protein
VKVRFDDPTVKVAAGAATVSEIGMTWGEFVAPVPVTVTEVL